eukprot:scaffold97_cov261-Pinguiococcus_pyrenoidosus.AAC.33
MWLRSPQTNSSPRLHHESTAMRLAIVPDGVKSAASFMNMSAASRSNRFTVGSSPQTSSPTSARNIALHRRQIQQESSRPSSSTKLYLRIANVGLVTVSERKSATRVDRKKRDRPRSRRSALLTGSSSKG